MSGGLLARFRAGLSRTRAALGEQLRQLRTRTRVDEDLWEQVEEALIQADVGVDTTLRLVESVKNKASTQRGADAQAVVAMLAEEVQALLTKNVAAEAADGRLHGESGTPKVILFAGVNGTGKTSSVGKLAVRLRREGRKVMLAAADTFRAAAGEQLQIWAQRAGAQIVLQGAGADPAAVTFDAIEAAVARKLDYVLVDTAGRLHNRTNLMAELAKVHRVCGRALPGAPHEVLLVIDATTGQNGLVQAEQFAQAIPVTGIVLTKLDGTAKGGIVVAIAERLGLQVRWVGLGEGPDDLEPFDAHAFAKAMFGGVLDAVEPAQ